MNILLQILEEGRLTDSFGRKIDFRNTIIIMTSNLGSDLIRRTTEVGFGVQEGIPDYKTMEDKIDKAVKKHFKPEFINRLDGVVIFRALDKNLLLNVINIEVEKLEKRLKKKEITLELNQESKEFLVNKGYQPEMGARPLRRSIEQYLEDPLAELVLREPEGQKHLKGEVEGDKIVFKSTEKAQEEDEDKLIATGAAKTKKTKSKP